jgi:hypothetical protein
LSTSQGICTTGKSDPGLEHPFEGFWQTTWQNGNWGYKVNGVTQILFSYGFNVLGFIVLSGLRNRIFIFDFQD